MTLPKTNDELLEEIGQLRLRLEESEAVVEAIRNGIVDAVVVNSTPGESVYTLEGAERPYRLLVEAMQEGVAVLNAEAVLLYCNPCLADLLKMSVENVTGCTLDGFVAESEHAIWRDVLRGAGNTSTKKEVRLRRHDGTTFPAALSFSILPSQKFCLLVTDLSQQKLYEELIVSKVALQQSEVRYRRLFETAKDGILILDTQTGKVTDANPFMSELLGYSHGYFSGKELWEIGLLSDKVANETAVRELQERGYIRFEHLPLETSTGHQVEVEIVANSYHEGGHSVIQCNIRDNSERNRMQNQMREQAVALEDLHRRKDEFLAMLSHELRNPLSPIVSAVQLLSFQKNAHPLQHQACTIIERQVGQLTRLIDDLLEVSRITTGRIHLQKSATAVNVIMEHAVETVRPLLDKRKHELTVSLSLPPILIDADSARMEQVIVNLLANAAKFTDEGGHIWLTAEQQNDECVLRVRDTGVGIAPELQPHVFELFTQAERSLDRSQGGLGIGLALVQQIVEMHRGRVEVVSELGQGSEFIVRLPVMKAAVIPPPTTRHQPVEPERLPLRVLLVDDNVDAAEMLGMVLLAAGYEVLTTHDGPSTLVAVLDYCPDVVLLDIGLPGMSGYEVAEKLRQQVGFQNMVLVAMTGYGQASDRLRSQEAGFDHHLVKPPDFIKLKQILTAVSERIWSPRASNGDVKIDMTGAVEVGNNGRHGEQEYRPV